MHTTRSRPRYVVWTASFAVGVLSLVACGGAGSPAGPDRPAAPPPASVSQVPTASPATLPAGASSGPASAPAVASQPPAGPPDGTGLDGLLHQADDDLNGVDSELSRSSSTDEGDPTG
jgi:hypothetical protein